MLKRIKENFENGGRKIKWFSSLFSERLTVEISVFRLLYQSEQMAKKKEDLLKDIGKRVREMKGTAETQVFSDKVVAEALDEIEKIDTEIESLKQKASDISRIEQ